MSAGDRRAFFRRRQGHADLAIYAARQNALSCPGPHFRFLRQCVGADGALGHHPKADIEDQPVLGDGFW